MNGTPLPQILQEVTLVSQLLLSNAKVFISYILISTCEVNYLEFKLLIMIKSKSKTKVILMEPINSSKTITLVIESCY